MRTTSKTSAVSRANSTYGAKAVIRETMARLLPHRLGDRAPKAQNMLEDLENMRTSTEVLGGSVGNPARL